MLEKVGENLSQAAKQEGAKGLDKMVSEKITLFGVGSGIFTLFCVFQGANLLLFNRFYLKKHIDTMNQFPELRQRGFPTDISQATLFDHVRNPVVIENLISLPIVFLLGNRFTSAYGPTKSLYFLASIIAFSFVFNQSFTSQYKYPYLTDFSKNTAAGLLVWQITQIIGTRALQLGVCGALGLVSPIGFIAGITAASVL